MSTKLVIATNNLKSRSLKVLSQELSKKLDHKVYRVRPHRVKKRLYLKYFGALDKLEQLKRFTESNIPCPEYTTDINTCKEWLRNGSVVVCRTLLRSSCGKGIVIACNENELVTAPLYTKYVKKKHEYRVHVLNGKVIDIQEKRKRVGFSGERNTKIRNLANGYVFCREGVNPPKGIKELGVNAVKSLSYLSGAVDIAYNEKNNRLVVLEVNSNPGLMGKTLENYVESIYNWYKEKRNEMRML